jgi:hypothetical protein
VDGGSGFVEFWARKNFFTLFASFNTLIDISAVVVLVKVLNREQRVKEDVEESKSNGWAQPTAKEDHPDLESSRQQI